MSKVLLVTADGARIPGWSYQLKKAFGQLGWDVAVFNYRAAQLHRFSLGRTLVAKSLVKRAVAVKPDLVLVTKGEGITAGTIADIKQRLPDTKTANYCLDEPFGTQMAFNKVLTMPEYDHFFIFDSAYIKDIEASGCKQVHWLPCSSDPELYAERVAWDKREWLCDAGFIGSHNKHREDVLRPIADLDLKVWGYRWSSVDKNSLLRQRVQAFVPKADKDLGDLRAMCRLWNLSRVNINIHHPQTKNNGANLRVFDLMASKSFQLCDSIPGLDDTVTVGRDLAVYTDATELRRQIEYYAQADDERRRMVEHAHKTFLEKHTTLYRVKELLSVTGLAHD
jgi:spore maturation protein CgeB